jgi:hypothetical protein
VRRFLVIRAAATLSANHLETLATWCGLLLNAETKVPVGSLAWLFERYRETTAWSAGTIFAKAIRAAPISVPALQAGRARLERAQHRADLHVSPFAPARRSHIALVELYGNGVVARDTGPLDLLDDRQHIGRKSPRIRLYRGRASFLLYINILPNHPPLPPNTPASSEVNAPARDRACLERAGDPLDTVGYRRPTKPLSVASGPRLGPPVYRCATRSR